MYVAVRGAHPGRTVDALRETNLSLLALSMVALTLTFFIRAVRWRSLFSAGRRPGFGAVLSAQFVGYLANAILPIRAGEAAAIVALNKKAQTPIAEGTATVFVQRAEDVLSLVLLMFLMLPWLPHVAWLRAAGAFAVALFIALAVLTVLLSRFGDRVIHMLIRPLRWFPFIPRQSLESAPAHFVEGLAGIVSLRIAVVSFAWTTLSWIVLGFGFWVVMEASAIHLSPLAGVLVVVGIGLAMILPSSPAALGVFEGATVVVLSAYGVDRSLSLSDALALHALNVLPLFAVGGILLLRRRFQLRRRVPEIVGDGMPNADAVPR